MGSIHLDRSPLRSQLTMEFRRGTDEDMRVIIGYIVLAEMEFNDSVTVITLLRAYTRDQIFVIPSMNRPNNFSSISIVTDDDRNIGWSCLYTANGYRFMLNSE